jgi:hypothetical protein
VEAIGPAALTHRRSPDHPRREWWLIFFGGDVHVDAVPLHLDDAGVRYGRRDRTERLRRRRLNPPSPRKTNFSTIGGRFGFCNREL